MTRFRLELFPEQFDKTNYKFEQRYSGEELKEASYLADYF